MDILAKIDRFFESDLRVFWYVVYGLALFLIFAGEIWLAIKDSGGVTAKKQTASTFAVNPNQIR